MWCFPASPCPIRCGFLHLASIKWNIRRANGKNTRNQKSDTKRFSPAPRRQKTSCSFSSYTFTFSYYLVLRLVLGSTRCVSKLEAGQFVVRVYCSQSRCGKKQEEHKVKDGEKQVEREPGEVAQVQVLNLKLIAQQILAKFGFHCAPKICLCLIRGNFLLFFWFFFLFPLHLLSSASSSVSFVLCSF